jgi:hypothetical protein
VRVESPRTAGKLRCQSGDALHINFSSMEVRGMLTRREFLKGTMGAATLVGLGSGISQAAPATESKIVKPERGCYLGFLRTFQFDPGKTGWEKIDYHVQYYKKLLGFNPKILAYYNTGDIEWGLPPSTRVLAENGIVPFVYMLTWGWRGLKEGAAKGMLRSIEDVEKFPRYKYSVDDIVTGKADGYLKTYAKQAEEYGRRHGGFFITTMQEVNNRYWDYHAHPKFREAWQRMWNKFEEAGANEWATWVWLVASPYAAPSAHTDPEPFYPGDQYVDWIGMSAHNRLNTGPIPQSQHLSFSDMVNRFADYLKKLHPDKPLMQAEFGKVNFSDQAKYLQEAYSVIKSRGDIHAAIYLDVKSPHSGDNWELRPDTTPVLQQVLKDDYWIKAK